MSSRGGARMGGIRGGSGGRSQRIVAVSQPYKTGSSVATTKRVYVGNLKFEVSWQDLKDHMKSVGNVVRADVILDPSGRSKGCGLVEYATIHEAQAAINELNDSDLQGRPIFVREDRESGEEGQGEGGGGKGGGGGTKSRAERGLPAPSSGPVVAKLGLSRHVYVGNLSWDVAWQDLKDHMKSVGEVVRADVLMESNGRSKGCGVVEYANVEGANAAILGLQNTELKGRPIFVREDRERIDEGAEESGGDGGDGGSTRLYVGNLDFKVRWFDLKDHFQQIGPVVRADVALEDDGTRSKGYGIVEYESSDDAARAIEELHDTQLNGRPIHVREDREEKRRY